MIERRLLLAALLASGGFAYAGRAFAQAKALPRSHGERTKEVVPFKSNEPRGTIIISNAERTLHVVLGDGTAAR